MRRKMIFLGLILSVFYLSSCGAILIKPKGPIGDVNYRVTDRINGEKTVEIVAQEKNKFSHWLYLSCDYIFGCYMRCEGPVNSCMKVATLSKFDMKYIMTKKKRHSSQPRCYQYCWRNIGHMGTGFWIRITIGAVIATVTLYMMWE